MSGTPEAFEIGRRLAALHSSLEERPKEFELLGRSWDLLPGVFAPVRTTSTEVFSAWLPYPPGGTEKGRLLLGFNSLGNLDRLNRLAAGCGLRTVTRRSVSRQAGDFAVDFLLLEFLPRPAARPARGFRTVGPGAAVRGRAGRGRE
ncbi:hypothetical protein GCM10010232_26850 [Streptomyces amakusaensis]|uniref:Uncharacterized protein n=1 Tax=Streptomyces amakusaensis TaxID=67271 RepID=A0ABW0ADM5_9ACTN